MKNLKGDLAGGFVAGIIALPLALAFGVQSGLGPTAGLYGAIAVGIFAAAFGGTPTQASGPTGPMTVVSASIVAYAVAKAGDVEAGLGIVLLAFLAGGIFQILLGVLGVGKYVKYFPYPVVSGFMSGVGLIIIFLQLWPLLGSSSPKSIVEVFTRIDEPIAALNVAAVGLGVLTILVNYGFPKITKKVPSVLVALLVGTLTSVAMGLDVPTIGDIPTSFPSLRLDVFTGFFGDLPSTEVLSFIVQSGVTLALLGSIDSLLTSVIADNLTKDRHDSNRELIGQGIGNTIAALFGGIPGAGATKGTVVNINAGGRTRLSGIVHGVFQLLVLVGAGSLAAHIPLSVLAGLLISVGIAIIDKKGFKHMKVVPRADTVVMLVVLVWTVFGNLVHAVGAGIVLASVLFMKRVGDLSEERSQIDAKGPEAASTREPAWEDEGEVEQVDEVFVKHLYGPLFFGSAAGFRQLASTLPESTRVLLIRMDRVPYMDQSGLYALEELLLDLREKGTKVLMTGLHEQPKAMLERVHIIPDVVPKECLCEGIESCMSQIDTIMKSPPADDPEPPAENAA
ncbi:MAG: SulP family inorganic anion transporter [Myxococcota bacterium]